MDYEFINVIAITKFMTLFMYIYYMNLLVQNVSNRYQKFRREWVLEG